MNKQTNTHPIQITVKCKSKLMTKVYSRLDEFLLSYERVSLSVQNLK